MRFVNRIRKWLIDQGWIRMSAKDYEEIYKDHPSKKEYKIQCAMKVIFEQDLRAYLLRDFFDAFMSFTSVICKELGNALFTVIDACFTPLIDSFTLIQDDLVKYTEQLKEKWEGVE